MNLKPRRPVLFALASLPLILVLVGLYVAGRRPQGPISAQQLVQALTGRGYEAHAQHAPDGRRVAYYLRRKGNGTPWESFVEMTHAGLVSQSGRLVITPHVSREEDQGSARAMLAEGYLAYQNFMVRGHPDDLKDVLDCLP